MRSETGYSLVEMMVATAVGLVLLAAAAALFRPAVDISYLLTQQAVVQQSVRSAMNVLTGELSTAGNGLTGGGVQLPDGPLSPAPKFGCDPTACYLSSNTYPNRRLYGLTPGDSRGATVNSITTDVVTVAYRDPESTLDQFPLLEVSVGGDQIRFDGQTDPAYNDPAVGVQPGDILIVCNANGCAAGVATAVVANGYVTLGSDPLDLNQSGAAFGNIKLIRNPSLETRAFRVLAVTYYVDGSTEDTLRLMRQVSAHPPRVAALNIENLQLSYDIFDENSASITNNLPDAGGTPNQIRKINLSITARSPAQGLFDRGYERMTLTTSVSPRFLWFRDRF